MFKTDLVRIQFNQVLNRKEALWWSFAGCADRGLLLEGGQGADGHQLDEVVLIHKAFVDANNEVSERLKLNENDSCNVEGQRSDKREGPIHFVAQLCDTLGQIGQKEVTSVERLGVGSGERERERERESRYNHSTFFTKQQNLTEVC